MMIYLSLATDKSLHCSLQKKIFWWLHFFLLTLALVRLFTFYSGKAKVVIDLRPSDFHAYFTVNEKVSFDFWHFSPIFVLLELTCLETLFDRKLQVFKISPKWTIFGIFNYLLSTQNANVARFARNDKWDFFCDFQTSCVFAKKFNA